MGSETSGHRPPAVDTAAAHDPPQSPARGTDPDLAPDIEIQPEHPAEDEEDVERMWEASDPVEGEAPTG